MFKQIAKQATKGREEGQGLVEYALILVLVAVVVIVVLLQLGPAVGNVFSEVMEVFDGGSETIAANEPAGNPNCEAINGAQYSDTTSNVIRVGDPVYTNSTCTGATVARDRLMVRAPDSGTANSLCISNGGSGMGFGGSNDWWFCN